MPDPVPVMVLGRLAVDTRAQGIKLGAALLKDTVTRVQSIAENAGCQGIGSPCVERARKAILRVLWFSSVTNAPDDLDASD